MNRGGCREAGFPGDVDRELLRETFTDARGMTGWRARVPCRPANHFHSVVEMTRPAGWPEAAGKERRKRDGRKTAVERLIPPPPHTRVIENINHRRQVIKRRARGFRDAEHRFLKIRAAFPGLPR